MEAIISKELLSEVLEYKVYDYTLKDTKIKINKITASTSCNEPRIIGYDKGINIYELAHKNLKEWAKLKSVFDIIDWSEEPEQIFKKAAELRNEIN